MALYDDYFTNEDKPFAENLNDALLLSNVFDMTVPVEFPKMFSNSTFVSTTSPRKCGVAILTLKEGLPSGVSVSTSDNKSVLTGTGTVKLTFYPNFNSFGQFKRMDWTNTGTVKVNLKTSTGTTIASDIRKGEIENQSSELRKLQEIVIEIVMTNATLKTFTVTMQNKDSKNRYGADVGIDDVNGLETRLTSIESKDTTQDGRLDIIEAKDVTQDSRLSTIEAKDVEQDSKISALETSTSDIVNVNLVSSNYLVKVGSTLERFTLTATLTDINGNPIKNKSIEFKKNGVTDYTTSTDNNGVATYNNAYLTTGGVYDFSVLNEHIIIRTYGFEEIKSSTSNRYVLRVDKARKVAMLELNLVDVTISSSDSEFELVNFIPSEYRPPYALNVFSHIARNYNLILYIWGGGGTVGIANKSSSTSTNVSANTMVQWSYE